MKRYFLLDENQDAQNYLSFDNLEDAKKALDEIKLLSIGDTLQGNKRIYYSDGTNIVIDSKLFKYDDSEFYVLCNTVNDSGEIEMYETFV